MSTIRILLGDAGKIRIQQLQCQLEGHDERHARSFEL